MPSHVTILTKSLLPLLATEGRRNILLMNLARLQYGLPLWQEYLAQRRQVQKQSLLNALTKV